MDAVEIMKEYGRMCSAEREYGCGGCELINEFNGAGEQCNIFIKKHPQKAVAIVEKWSAEHPKKTRQSEFLKMFPRVRTDDDGVIYIHPCDVDTSYKNENGCGNISCRDCKEKYWLAEVDND